MEYEIQFARLSTTEKLPDRFLNTQMRTATDLSKSSMGQIYWLIEILTPWFPTAQIGQTIINTFSENYYKGGSTSDLVNFEEALKKVNETLAQITQNGETDWIGNLNGVLGIIVGDKLHLAQTGKCEAYIFRDGKANQLTYGLSNGAETHPLKTFSNITSGELKSHDKILIANPDIFQHFSIEGLRQIVALNDPNESVLQIAKILKKKKTSSVNVLIMNLLDREEMAKIAATEPSTVYLDRPLESFWAGSKRVWQQLVYPILKFFAKSSQKAGKKSLNFTKNYVKTLQEKRKSKEPIKKKDLFDKEFIEENPSDDLLKDEEIKYSPELEVHYYNEEKRKKENKTFKVFESLKRYASIFWGLITKTATNKKTRPYFYIALAIILLVVIGLVINNKRSSSNKNLNLAQAQSILREAESAQNDAKNAELSNDQEKAKQLFQQAIDKAKSVQDFPIVSSDAKNIIISSYTELDKLTQTTRFSNLDPLFSLSNQIKSVIVYSGNAYLVTQNAIFKGLLSGGKPTQVASLPKNGGDCQFAILMGKDIFLYTSSQKVYDFQTDKESIDIAQGPNTWETANAGNGFSGNIYLLDGIMGKIYKHSSSSNGFGEGQSYITSTTANVKDSVSIAIDGAVYVLRSDGQAIKLQLGKLQEFSLQDIPTPSSKIEKPLEIYTDADTPSIYVLDGVKNRILEFDKTGHFTHQFALPDSFTSASNFFISYKSKKIWVTNDKSMYEISI